MAKALSPIVLILGQDSLRADRALAGVLKERGIDPSEIVRLWGDESSFGDVFTAATSRSLFSDRTVVVVRRAEKLRGGGRDPDEDAAEEKGELPEPVEEPREKGDKRKAAGKAAADPANDIPDLDPSSTLIFVVRKTDRRFGMWKKISKVAELIDADYLRGKALSMAAFAEAKALGVRVPDDLLKDLVEQSGPSLGRIASELEKMLLYQGPAGRGAEDSVAVGRNAARIVDVQTPAADIERVDAVVAQLTRAPVPEPMPVVMHQIVAILAIGRRALAMGSQS